MVKKSRMAGHGGRETMFISNGSFRVLVELEKGMTPELSLKSGNAWVNAHWIPWYRANSGEPWNAEKHTEFWKAPLLYDIAGNFPCLPNFGPDHKAGDYMLPAHGYTAAMTWKIEEEIESGDAAGFRTRLDNTGHPFEYGKIDLVTEGQNVHYTSLDVVNTGGSALPMNYGWHNTLGSPFLESGCIVDNSAEAYAVPPKGSEFDDTGRLEFGAECDSLSNVPLRDGGSIDLRIVPGITGYTDFITGAVSADCPLAWNTVINPRLKLVYISFSPGPAAASDTELPLYFHDMWMNYGGRNFSPWAPADGMTDWTFCLGTENATGYFANGLQASTDNAELLGNPTHVSLGPGERGKLFYGTAMAVYEAGVLDGGVKAVEASEDGLVLTGYNGKYLTLAADGSFSRLKKLAG